MKTIRILLLLLMPILIFADPAKSQPPQDQPGATQEDLRKSIDNLTRVTADLTRVVNTLAENSQSVQNPNTTENGLRIVVPIILAIIGAVAWVNRKIGKIDGLEQAIQRLGESIQNLRAEVKVEIQNLRAEVKAEIQNLREELKIEIQNLREELKIEIQNLREELKTDGQNLEKELKIEIQNLKEMVHELDKGLQTVIVQSKNTDKWVEDIKLDIREIRSEISLLRGQKPGEMPKIEGES